MKQRKRKRALVASVFVSVRFDFQFAFGSLLEDRQNKLNTQYEV
jgi:hypothetical protein